MLGYFITIPVKYNRIHTKIQKQKSEREVDAARQKKDCNRSFIVNS